MKCLIPLYDAIDKQARQKMALLKDVISHKQDERKSNARASDLASNDAIQSVFGGSDSPCQPTQQSNLQE